MPTDDPKQWVMLADLRNLPMRKRRQVASPMQFEAHPELFQRKAKKNNGQEG